MRCLSSVICIALPQAHVSQAVNISGIALQLSAPGLERITFSTDAMQLDHGANILSARCTVSPECLLPC